MPRDVEYIVNKTLLKNTDERYQNTKDLLTDLRRVKQRVEFEQIGLSFQPEDSKSDLEAQETKILDSSDLEQIILLENAPPNNLMENTSPIIGRKKEIAEITDLLKQESVRLLTMTGIGGTGKTRLAQTVSRRMLGEFSDGVFFVVLAPITDHKLVVPTIAQTLGVKEAGDETILEVLKNYLHDKQILLVIDNFEQVVEAAPDIAELLESSDKLKILVTSRELLNLRAEHEYSVSPLTLPSAETQISVDELLTNEAVRFFVERARFAVSDFALTGENADTVAEICRRLNGLPLAIELAAARIKLFTPAAILKRLENSLNLLTGGSKDLPERQQTMRGAIAWSYDLLDEDEKKLFDRLAVFAEGFTLDGAGYVGEFVGKKENKGKKEKRRKEEREQLDVVTAAVSPSPRLPVSSSILDGISSLLDKSLIIRGDQTDGEPRFRMLVVVREFALEQLAASGEEDEIKRMHAGFYMRLSEIAQPELMTEKAAKWLDTLEQEHDNLRAALEWSLKNQPETALRIVLAIHWFWIQRGYLPEGNKWTKRALDSCGEGADPKLQAEGYNALSLFSSYQDDIEAAEKFATESLRLARGTDDKYLISIALAELGNVKINYDLAQAKVLIEESLAIARELNDKRAISLRLNSLGEIARHQDDYESARKYYEEALTIAREESIKISIPLITLNLAATECLLGNNQKTLSHALDSLKVSEEIEDKISIGIALSILAVLANAVGDVKKAARLFGAAQAIHNAVGFKIEKSDRKFIDPCLTEARTAIGDEAFDAAHAEGRQLSIEEAIAFVREGEIAVGTQTHITNKADWDTKIYETNDTLETQTAQASTVETAVPKISPPHNFLSRFWQKRTFVTALIIFLLTVGGFSGYRYYLANDQIQSIAVMPFVNESGNGDVEYLSDGMTETLINSLSQIPNLSVKARSSVFRYKGKELDAKKVASDLNVQAILTGRVSQLGNQMVLNLELIDAQKENVLWGNRYTLNSSELVSLQSKVAHDVSNELKIKLSGEEVAKVEENFTDNSEAYQLYLKGRFHWNKRDADEFLKAADFFNQAIEKDPKYALAYSGLADSYGLLPYYGAFRPKEYMPKAKAAALKALRLDDNLAEAHASLGQILLYYDFDWEGAEREYKRAIELDPNYSTSHQWYGLLLTNAGRHDEAIKELSRALELDPISIAINQNMADFYTNARRTDEAIAQYKKLNELFPDNPYGINGIGTIYAIQGKYPEAVEQYLKAMNLNGDADPELLKRYKDGFEKGGWKGYQRVNLEILQENSKAALEKDKDAFIPSFDFAYAYGYLGDREKTLEYLNKAYDERSAYLTQINVDYPFDFLRDDPQFKEFLKKVGFK